MVGVRCGSWLGTRASGRVTVQASADQAGVHFTASADISAEVVVSELPAAGGIYNSVLNCEV
jgi:hypothetical protein